MKEKKKKEKEKQKRKKEKEKKEKEKEEKRNGLRGEVLVIRLPLCCPRMSRERQS